MANLQRLFRYSKCVSPVTIGGGDVASLLGVNPYCSRDLLVSRKSAVGKRRNPALDHGTRYEGEAIELDEREFGKTVLRPPHRYHTEYPFLGCSPDGVTTDEELLEVKCPLTRKVSSRVPPMYMPQLQISLEILDLEMAHYVEYVVHSCFLQVIEVERDRKWFRKHLGTLCSAAKEIEDRRKWHSEPGN